MVRESRKLDHLKYALLLSDGPTETGFKDIQLIHQCLPNMNWQDIDVSTTLMGIKLSFPLLINAVTGGALDVTNMNRKIAEFAKETEIPMAVGSQYAAIANSEVLESFQVVRQVNPNGVIFANLGAYTSVDDAKRAVNMIRADALQIHLNVAQEIFMGEGDRHFDGYLAKIAAIVEAVDVPVIVKEVGFGIAKEQAIALSNIGVNAIDIGGTGGTNFLAIEAARIKLDLSQETLKWGIPTAISAAEVASVLPNSIDMIVSGGIRTPMDVVKSIALGGTAVGFAAPVIRALSKEPVEKAVDHFQHFTNQIKIYMLLVGAKSVPQLKQIPFIVMGYSREWLTARGIDINQLAQRKIFNAT